MISPIVISYRTLHSFSLKEELEHYNKVTLTMAPTGGGTVTKFATGIPGKTGESSETLPLRPQFSD